MTDIKAWVDEHRAIHRNGWDGKWSWTLGDLDKATLKATGGYVDFDLIRDDEFRGPTEVLDEIVDAHNVTVPTALSMIEAVLELHEAFRYYEHEDVCENNDERHRAERHVEFEVGEYYCEDLPTDDVVCRSCRDADGEFIDYPCATRRALEGVIDGE